jgi:hypothetical protein
MSRRKNKVAIRKRAVYYVKTKAERNKVKKRVDEDG